MAPTSPTVRRRLLSQELKRLRTERGLTVAQAASRAGWSASGLTRAETNKWRLPDIKVVAALLDVYDVPEPRRSELLTIARSARQRGWWFAYREEIGDEYAEFIGLEAGCSTIRTFEPQVVPGLLQTEAYARALMTARKRVSPEQIDVLVEVRMQRQQQLLTDTTDPLELWAIIEEAVLHRQVGGPDVMREQLEHLVKLGELPHVNLGLVPFSRGTTPGAGPMVLMTFAEGNGPEAGYLETMAGAMWVEEEDALNRLRTQFEELLVRGDVLPAADTMAFIREMASPPAMRAREIPPEVA